MTGTSDATVIRAVQSLGFAGMGELKKALLSTLGQPSTPAENMRRTLAETGADAEQALRMVVEIHAESVEALRGAPVRAQITAAVAVLHSAERIVVFGIGPTAFLAGYGAMLLERTGRRSKSLTATGSILADQLLDLRAGDGMLAFAYGRPYREVRTVFAEARRLNLPVVLVTDQPDHALARQADIVLAVPRGRAGQVALHGATLMALEALLLGLAAVNQDKAMTALGRLETLRKAIGEASSSAV